MENIIEIEGLEKSYGDVKAVDGITFNVKSGSLFAFLGVNGAGKSTLCRIITGLCRATGSVSLDGEILKRKRLTQKSFFVQQDSDYQLYAPTVLDEFSLGKKETAELKETALSRLREMGPVSYTHLTLPTNSLV